MNRYEQHMYAAKLRALELEEMARKEAERIFGKQQAEAMARRTANEREAMENGWPMYFDYARAFDGPLRSMP